MRAVELDVERGRRTRRWLVGPLTAIRRRCDGPGRLRVTGRLAFRPWMRSCAYAGSRRYQVIDRAALDEILDEALVAHVGGRRAAARWCCPSPAPGTVTILSPRVHRSRSLRLAAGTARLCHRDPPGRARTSRARCSRARCTTAAPSSSADAEVLHGEAKQEALARLSDHLMPGRAEEVRCNSARRWPRRSCSASARAGSVKVSDGPADDPTTARTRTCGRASCRCGLGPVYRSRPGTYPWASRHRCSAGRMRPWSWSMTRAPQPSQQITGHPTDPRVRIERIGQHRYKATNRRGGVVTLGSGADPTSRRWSCCSPHRRVQRHGRRHDHRQAGYAEVFRRALRGAQGPRRHGNRLADLRCLRDHLPRGGGRRPRAGELPRAIGQSRDRLCSVGRTVAVGTPVEYGEGSVGGWADDD